MSRVLLSIFFITFTFANNTTANQSDKENNLENALIESNIFEQNITSQTGAISNFLYEPKYTNRFLAPYNGSNIHFGGIGKISPVFKPKYENKENNDNSPAFMFTFQKKGDQISIGGDIRGVDVENFNKYLDDKKSE